MLSTAIDRVWQSDRPRIEVASHLIPDMGDHDLLSIAAFDVCSMEQAIPSSVIYSPEQCSLTIQVHKRTIRISRLVRNPIQKSLHITYRDAGISIEVATNNGHFEPASSHSGDLSKVLSAIQVARDHIDSILLLPFEMREKRLITFADEFSMPLEQFRFLSSQYSRLAKEIL